MLIPASAFEADSHVTIYVNSEGEGRAGSNERPTVFKAGRISPETDAQVTFYYPGLQDVHVGGEKLPRLDAGDGWVKVMVPKIAAVGAHDLEFVLSTTDL